MTPNPVPDFIEPPVIRVTKDYDKFKKLLCNRKTMHMAKFSKSVGKCNKLYVHPIIVTKHMEVIDGQHRLEYAKTSDLPIYYVIDDNFHITDLIAHNTTASNWSISEYGNFYSTCDSQEITAQQKSDYNFLLNVCKEYSIAYDVFLKIFHKYQGTGHASTDFKNGQLRLKFTQDQIIQYLIPIDNIVTYLKKNKIIGRPSIHIYMALYKIIRLEGYDHERMFKKMDDNIDSVLLAFKFRNYDEIASRLIDVYNKNSKNKLTLRAKSDF